MTDETHAKSRNIWENLEICKHNFNNKVVINEQTQIRIKHSTFKI